MDQDNNSKIITDFLSKLILTISFTEFGNPLKKQQFWQTGNLLCVLKYLKCQMRHAFCQTLKKKSFLHLYALWQNFLWQLYWHNDWIGFCISQIVYSGPHLFLIYCNYTPKMLCWSHWTMLQVTVCIENVWFSLRAEPNGTTASFPPCFRENVIVTCKIVSFLCCLDNFLLLNVIVFFFGNQISKGRSFEKGAIFDLLFTFFSHQGEDTKIPSAHISLTYTYYAHPIDLFCLPNFAKIVNLSCKVSLWYDSWCWFLFAPFWSNQ